MMEIIIEYVNGCFRQTMIAKNDKNRTIKRTNNMDKIQVLVRSLPTKPTLIEAKETDLKIIYGKTNVVILKDYKKHLNSKLYSSILNKIDSSTPIVKKVKYNQKLLQLIKKLQKDKKRAITFVLATLVSTAIIGDSLLNKKETTKDDSPIESVVIDDEQKEANDVFITLAQDEDFDFETRVKQATGSAVNQYTLNKIVQFINSDDGNYFLEVANDFGIDPYIFLSLMIKESSLDHEATIPGGKNYNGFGVGICQLETPNGQQVNAFNYSTGTKETIYETMENALDKKTNIKIGIMRYQNVLEKYQGNENLALQSYNYGQGLMDLIITVYANEIGSSYEQVVADFEDTGWLKYVRLVHANPVQFVNSLDQSQYSAFNNIMTFLQNWPYGTYGDDNYLNGVKSYYVGVYGQSIVDGEVVQINHLTNEVVKLDKENLKNDHQFT